MLAVSSLFDYEWEYSSYNNRITSFAKNLAKRGIDVVVNGATYGEYLENRNNLVKEFDYDVAALKPGKLYVGDYYLNCYIVASVKGKKHLKTPQTTISFTILAEKLVWIYESLNKLRIGSTAEAGQNLDYPHDYPFDYALSDKVDYINNDSISECEFVMTIYGSCEEPCITIGKNRYIVYGTLETGEYLTIDSREQKVYKTKANGTQVNMFANRNRDYYIFQKIASGRSIVNWNGNFNFDITLHEERSEPEWI